MTDKNIKKTIKRTATITIEMGYADGPVPEFVSVDVKGCSTIDLFLAKQSLESHICERVDNPCQFLADCFGALAKQSGLDTDPNQKD